jgi:Lipocalin-like domain
MEANAMNRYGVNRYGVNPRGAAATTALAFVCLGFSIPATAQSLQQKIVGTWTLESGSENYPDGKRNVPWATGNLIIDSTGHASLFLVGRDQPDTSPSVRTPVGPFVAYYGTYTVNEAEKVLTWKVDRASSPLFNGAVRTQKISFNGDVMTWTGSEVKTPEGTMTPVNQWKPAK